MKTTFLVLTALACSFSAFAQSPSQSREQFCQDRQDKNFVKNLTSDSDNLMPFQNRGGIVNGGVCWWHSRFQRNALYLTIYDPSLPLPTKEEARKLVKQIREADHMVVIPGYRNFSEFASDQKHLIQRELEKWQKGDGVIRFAWVNGLSGKAENKAEKLKAMMDKIYEDVEVKNNISYNKLQIPGIVAHAWLVIHMVKVDGGYDLEILDSNFNEKTSIYKYREGATSFNYHASFPFSPILDYTVEMKKINKVISKECGQDTLAKNE